MRIFPLGLTVLFVILVIVISVLHSPDRFYSHKTIEKDKEAIFEAQQVLKNLNLTMIRFGFSTEKEERYSLCYNSTNLLGPASVSLTSRGHNMKDFRATSRQLVKIFEREGIKVETRKVNDWFSNIQQTMVLSKHFPEQLSRIIEDCGKYFYHLEVENWRIVPDLKK